MTFIEQLHSHIGGLIRLKSQIYWYDTGLYDKIEGSICILLDIIEDPSDLDYGLAAGTAAYSEKVTHASDPDHGDPHALLFIGDSSKWVWISEKTVELVQ